MNSPTLDGFAEAAAALTPSAVSQFLASSRWRLESRRDNLREVWRLTDLDGRDAGRIMLPLATDYEDYPSRFRDALLALGRIHQWDPDELYERVIAANADLFFSGPGEPGFDGANRDTCAHVVGSGKAAHFLPERGR